MNPYAEYLDGRDPLPVISATPQRIRTLIDTLGGERAQRPPAPGKWSAREIVCHLADSEIVFAFRFRQTLAETDHVIQPFDQEKWASHYQAYGVDAALEVLSAVRRWNLALIRSVNREELAKKVTHPERGEMTFQTILETMAGHDLNHIRQIERIATQSAEA